MDPSLKADASRKGSYYRRIEDIGRALETLDADRLSPALQFLTYYFGCEKLARGLVGIHARWPALKAYAHSTKIPLLDIQTASSALSLTVRQTELAWIFADFNEQSLLPAISPRTPSARVLRNSITHDFGPSNVARIADLARSHNPRMKRFLGCAEEVLSYQRQHFSDIS